ncbi:MAG: lysylphosphatidylglycerol synthase transmembrane domain-containing protein [Planctomycetota bacterium]
MTPPRKKKTKYIFLVLRIAVVTAGIIWAVIWLSSGQRWQNLLQIFKKMNLLLFAAVLVVFALGQVLVALRWWILTKTQAIFIPFSAALRLHFLGLFYNNFLPGSVGGDLIRAWYVTRHTEKKFEAVLSVFVDRVIGLASTLLIAIFFYAIFLRGQAEQLNLRPETGLITRIAQNKHIFLYAAGALLILLVIFFSNKPGRHALKTFTSKLAKLAASLIKKLQKAAVIYCKKPLALSQVFALTVFLQIMTITAFWVLGKNLGIHVSVRYYYVFFTMTWVLGAIPVSIGGAVVVEGTLAYMFIHLASVQPESALALALTQRIIWMLASLPGAGIHLVGAHLPKDFSIDYQNAIN